MYFSGHSAVSHKVNSRCPGSIVGQIVIGDHLTEPW